MTTPDGGMWTLTEEDIMSKYINSKYEFLYSFIKFVENEGYAKASSNLNDSDRKQVKKHFESSISDVKRRMRQEIRQYYENHPDPLTHPLSEAWRHGIDEDGESGWDCIIIPDKGETDEDIEAFIDYEVGYPPIWGPYDCTGKRFTWLKTWKRTPVGIAITHRWGLDV